MKNAVPKRTILDFFNKVTPENSQNPSPTKANGSLTPTSTNLLQNLSVVDIKENLDPNNIISEQHDDSSECIIFETITFTPNGTESFKRKRGRPKKSSEGNRSPDNKRTKNSKIDSEISSESEIVTRRRSTRARKPVLQSSEESSLIDSKFNKNSITLFSSDDSHKTATPLRTSSPRIQTQELINESSEEILCLTPVTPVAPVKFIKSVKNFEPKYQSPLVQKAKKCPEKRVAEECVATYNQKLKTLNFDQQNIPFATREIKTVENESISGFFDSYETPNTEESSFTELDSEIDRDAKSYKKFKSWLKTWKKYLKGKLTAENNSFEFDSHQMTFHELQYSQPEVIFSKSMGISNFLDDEKDPQ